jgi:PLP dependent protein
MTGYPISGSITERIDRIRQTLPPTVRLIAVSKQVSVAAMREAYAAGIRDFGESKVQETEEKQQQLSDLPEITWHLIGHLQTNKVQKALSLFQWIHSVDSLKLADRLNRAAAALDKKPHVCLQVKLLPDPNKYGWSVDELIADLGTIAQFENLKIHGLMTIPPQGLSDLELSHLFKETCKLGSKIQQQNFSFSHSNIHIQEFSMGMSEDYKIAIAAGSTMIRLGRILFGDRPPILSQS